jgi:hypothetical protein
MCGRVCAGGSYATGTGATLFDDASVSWSRGRGECGNLEVCSGEIGVATREGCPNLVENLVDSDRVIVALRSISGSCVCHIYGIN